MGLELVGITLGDYRLDDVIGEGGMATVFKAYQISLKRWVAVKVLYYQAGTSLARFQLEAKAIASLRHRNILNIYGYGEQDGLPYIVMEYIEGGTLEDRLTGSPMSWRRVVDLAIPMAKALHYAHRHNIIHRDVKPSNILMPQENWPILADFGLVKRYDQESSITQTGTFMGTPSYIAPEQARDSKLDARADMYSLGVVLFEMVTGRVPFDYDFANKILLAHISEPPPSPRELNPNCPVELEAIILKTLQKEPADRFSDMQEMLEALSAILRNPPAVDDPLPDDGIPPETHNLRSEGGVFDSLRQLFQGKLSKADGEKTASQPELDLLDDDETGTIQLNPPSSSHPQARIVLKDRAVTIDLPRKSVLTLGRSHGNIVVDIDLEPYQASKYGVSRRHARLIRRGNTWLLEDLHSLNGTFVNDKEIKHGEPVILKHGDVVRLSNMAFTFEFL